MYVNKKDFKNRTHTCHAQQWPTPPKYICAGRMIDDTVEIGDTSEADITNDDHTNGVSDGASTLVNSVNTSMELIDIPSDMYPNELLHALSDEIQIEIYYR